MSVNALSICARPHTQCSIAQHPWYAPGMIILIGITLESSQLDLRHTVVAGDHRPPRCSTDKGVRSARWHQPPAVGMYVCTVAMPKSRPQATSTSGKSRYLKAKRFGRRFCILGFIDAGHGVCAAYDRFLLSGQVNGCFLLHSKREPRLVANTPFSLAINEYHVPITKLNLWQPALALQFHACPVSIDASRCFSLNIAAYCCNPGSSRHSDPQS